MFMLWSVINYNKQNKLIESNAGVTKIIVNVKSDQKNTTYLLNLVTKILSSSKTLLKQFGPVMNLGLLASRSQRLCTINRKSRFMSCVYNYLENKKRLLTTS